MVHLWTYPNNLKYPSIIPNITLRAQNLKALETHPQRMQKREQGKSGGAAAGTTATPAKRGRPFGSTASNAAAAAAAAASDTAAPSTLLGPSLLVHTSFTGLPTSLSLKTCNLSLKDISELSWLRSSLGSFDLAVQSR